MGVTNLLIANRSEIAIRIARAASELGIRTVAVAPEDDAQSLHTRKADEVRALPGQGAMAYLDIEAVIAVAKEAACDAVHPGYGFLSENATFARRCADEGLAFVGPRPEVLDLFGDKVRAREAAAAAGVPVLGGTSGPTSVEEARAFLASLGGDAMIIKAVAGGGGRGVRVVREDGELGEAYQRCQSEAKAAFGNGDVYVEQFVPLARHIEVQIAGDGSGAVTHFGERDCSIQRRHQKIVEIAPSPGLPHALRERIIDAAVRLAREVRYDNIGTFEFLVDATEIGDESPFHFIEANPRLQVEHTVTEEVMGVDLVQLQLRLAGGRTLEDLGIAEGRREPRGYAIQVRVNMETMRPDGVAMPSGGTLTAFEPPSGPGVRTDTFGYAGYRTSPRYDSLLAKVIAHAPAGDFADAAQRTYRALCEFRVEGVNTNIPFLQALLQHPDVRGARMYTRFIDDHIAELVSAGDGAHLRLFFDATPGGSRDASNGDAQAHEAVPPPEAERRIAGARVDPNDPLAVLVHGKTAAARRAEAKPALEEPDGTVAVTAPLQGTVVSVAVAEGDRVRAGQQLFVLEAMKMEHEVLAASAGIVRKLEVAPGDTIWAGHALAYLEVAERAEGDMEAALAEEVDLDEIRPDLREVLDRRALTRDEHRPKAVARRRATGQRTARENIEDLVDPGTFTEYGPLVVAAQRNRRTLEDLIERSPADGMICGTARINGDLFGEPASRCAILCYDYTVFAGTQGRQNHVKTDRVLKVAEEWRLPLVLFAEGGGGRPGDGDGQSNSGGSHTFHQFARLSGLVPLVGISSGRCFAGNASLLGCCDVIIATANSNIGMGGPAMIEGGGLGVFTPEEIGPMEVQVPNGVVDIAVEDEAEAVAVAKRYLAYFQGPVQEWEAPDQRILRRVVPENRLRVYNVRTVIETLADIGSVLELRKDFGLGMVTSLVRIEGKPLGIIANNPMHLGGAIDADAADKGARFMQLCDAFDLPILFLCDTPGIMVGPEVEKTALVRHANRMFLIGANLSVPMFTIVLRKSYGLGAIAMAGGSFKVPYFSLSWPTGEFGGMGLEGMVKLGYRDELAAIEDPAERKRAYDEMVARAYERGKALNNATNFGVDDTIDPAESRWWIASALASYRPKPRPEGKRRPAIDGW